MVTVRWRPHDAQNSATVSFRVGPSHNCDVLPGICSTLNDILGSGSSLDGGMQCTLPSAILVFFHLLFILLVIISESVI